MFYRHSIDQCLASSISGKGVGRSALDLALKQAGPALDSLRRRHADGSLPLLRLPAERGDLTAPRQHAERLAKSFDHVVILGTGGSSLGGQTLAALADLGFGPRPGTPKLWFMDNVDPATFAELFARLDAKRTAFIAISKSGGTAETLTQLFAALEWLEGGIGKARLAGHVLIITEPKDNPLRRLGARLGIAMLDHDPGVGGRFSVLSLVGLMPAMIAGLDAEAIRQGAASVLDPTLKATRAEDCAPALGAALSIALQREHGIATTVLMPYVDRLGFFGLWYRQLWAESLGKDGHGTTPIRAMGTVDQHSQLQLYLAGPADKMFTVVMLDTAGQGAAMAPASLGGDKDLAYLGGRTMGDLLAAEARATADTLARNGRPTRVIALDRLDEKVMGALLMHFMLETMIAAELLGVDAFDQPAVEEGKILTRQYLAGMRTKG